MVSYEEVVNELLTNYPDALAVAIIDSSNNIVYSTDNWDISADVRNLMSIWKSQRGQFVKVQGVKYSILQMTEERLIATNFGKQGHLIGASTPDGSYYVVAYVSPDAEAWNHLAYPAVARAAGMLAGGSSISAASRFEGGGGASTGYGADASYAAGGYGAAAQGQSSIDPNLKAEIEAFLQWIKDPQGLAAYINYYLQINDTNVINQLVNVYNEFRRIFNF